MVNQLDSEVLKRIDKLVKSFISNKELFSRTLNSLQGYITLSTKLKPYIHTIKARVKDPNHLRHKLIRKANKAKSEGKEFDITLENLSLKINDLVGIRIIHLHTKQIEQIDKHLKKILKEEHCEIIEGPTAKTWDDESRNYFASIGIKIEHNPNMYTSVHYDVRPNSKITCEIQVRTLMEEVWGEVDHTINYPDPTDVFSCREQLKALARSTSSCSRLVDSIFSTYSEFETTNKSKSKKLPNNSKKTISPSKKTISSSKKSKPSGKKVK